MRSRSSCLIVRYGVSHFGKALLWVAAEGFFLYYLTDVVQMPANAAGALFLGLLLWSAACDIVVGRLCDRHAPPPRQLRVLMTAAATISALAFLAIFSAPGAGAQAWLWVAIASLVFRTSYSVADVPHNALIRRLRTAGADATALSAAREITGLTAGSAMALAALLVLAPGGAIPQRTHFRLFAAAVSAVSLIAFVGAVPVVPDSSNATHAARAEGRGGLYLRAAPIVLAAVMGFMLSGLFTKSLVYFAKYALLAPRWTTRAIILTASGQFFGAFGWRHAARYIPTLQANRYAYASTACTAALLALSAGDRMRIEAGLFVLGVMIGGTNMLAWALLPTIVDQFERGGGRASEASVFGAFTCLSKVAVGMSGWLLTRLLGAFTISPTTLVSPMQGRQLFIAAAVLMGVGALTSLALLVPVRSGRRMVA